MIDGDRLWGLLSELEEIGEREGGDPTELQYRTRRSLQPAAQAGKWDLATQ